MITDTVIAAVAFVLLLVAGHYFPWPGDVLNRFRVLRYTYGLGSYMVCLTYVLVMHGLALWAGIAWGIAIAGGVTNVVCYAYDGRMRDRRRAAVSERALDGERADRF